MITGFHDWRELAGNVWRCRDNPSCRLILGPPSETPPILRDGPLVRALKDTVDTAAAEFCFITLPVTWGTASGLDLTAFDIVIHIGLGVYDSHDTLLLEHGAYNFRGTGADALRTAGANEPIEPGAPKHLKLSEAMLKRYADLRREPSKLAQSSAEFSVVEAPSRKENAYICNETHWRALRAVEASMSADGRPAAAYFIHVPYANPDRVAGYEELAHAVAALVNRIVRIEAKAQ